MDNFGVRGKRIQLAGDAIVKTGAYRDQQVTFLYCKVGRFSTVHPQHAQIVGIIRRYRTQPFQGRRHGHLRNGKKFAQRRYRLRHPHAAANV